MFSYCWTTMNRRCRGTLFTHLVEGFSLLKDAELGTTCNSGDVPELP
jgi:hypothetical protein